MKTAVVEKDVVGGRCLNYACIPAKAVLRSADVLTEIREAGEFGIDGRRARGRLRRRRRAPREGHQDAHRRRRRACSRRTTIDVIEGQGVADGRRQRQGRRHATYEANKAVDPRHRLGQAADPRHDVRRPRHRHRGGVGARASCRARSRRRRRRVGHRDRLGLRAPRHRGHALRGPGPRAAHRGRRHLQARRARLQEAGHQGPHETFVENVEAGDDERDLHLRRRGGRGRLARHRRRPRARRRGARASTRPASSSTEHGPDRGRRRAAHLEGQGSTPSATSSPARRSRTRPPTRASSPSRTPPAMKTHPIDYLDIPRATFCTPNVGSFGLTEEQAARAGLRRRRRQGPVRRGRRRHGLRRPHRRSSRSSATRSTASCSAATSSARRRPS